MKKHTLQYLLIGALLLGAIFMTACSSAGGSEPAAGEMEEMDHDNGDMNHDDADMNHDDGDMEHEHDDDGAVNRIPNQNGAAITIISPADGDTVNALDQVLVEVDVENFELTSGAHWHVYVDDVSYGMVMGGNTDQALPGLEPGEHEISVYLSLETHEEYEDGDSVTIIVEE